MKTTTIKFAFVLGFSLAGLLSINSAINVHAQSFDEGYTYSDGTTFSGDVTCSSCNTTLGNTYTSGNVYTPSYTYDAGSVYTPTTYTANPISTYTYTTSPTYSYVTTPTVYTTPISTYTPTYSYTPTYTQPSYPACSFVNGITTNAPCSCPSGSLTFVNASCGIYHPAPTPVPTPIPTPVPTPTTKQCANGTIVYIGATCYTSCPNGQTVPEGSFCPAQTQVCWNGSVIPVNQACPSQYKQCANGTTVSMYQSCTKVCANGNVVNENETCYRTCPNGTTIPDYQSCPVVQGLPWVDIHANPSVVAYGQNAVLSWTSGNARYCNVTNGWTGSRATSGSETRYNLTNTTTYSITCTNGNGQSATDAVTVYVNTPQVKVNNVVTSIPTQIANTSARCNGIGLIADSLASNAWFEYGTTQNLGSKTVTAYIGTAATSPFTNLLTGLTPNTRYYCRAVMSNSLGVVKGDIVSFTTKNAKISYVAPVVKTPTKVTPAPKKELLCADGSTPTLRYATTTTSSTVDGQKLVTLDLQKTNGTLAPESMVEYTLAYNNTSNSNLTDVLFKINLPAELALAQANGGTYDPVSRVLTVPVAILAAHDSGVIKVSAKVAKDAMIGKSMVVQGYVEYTIPTLTANGTAMKDEVMTYVVGSILPASNGMQNGTPSDVATHTDASTNSFLPTTLVEWLALFTIFVILVLLGRSMYVSYKESKGEGSAHH